MRNVTNPPTPPSFSQGVWYYITLHHFEITILLIHTRRWNVVEVITATIWIHHPTFYHRRRNEVTDQQMNTNIIRLHHLLVCSCWQDMGSFSLRSFIVFYSWWSRGDVCFVPLFFLGDIRMSCILFRGSQPMFRRRGGSVKKISRFYVQISFFPM